MESFSESKNMARVSAGFKGGPMFQSLNLAPSMTIKEGWPSETEQKLKMAPIKQGTPMDVWNQRRSK